MNICSTNNVFQHFYSLDRPNNLNFYLKISFLSQKFSIFVNKLKERAKYEL